MILETATDYLKKMFAHTSGDIILLADAYKAFGREAYPAKANRTWLGNKLTFLKRHDLVTPIYMIKDNSQVLEKIQLTPKGKNVLDRSETRVETLPMPSSVQERPKEKHIEAKENGSHAISLTDVVDIVAELKKRSQNNSLTVDINLKEAIVSIRI